MRIVPELAFLNQPVNDLDIVAMHNCRELEISFNPDDQENLLQLAGLPSCRGKNHALEAACVEILHGVNARKHSESKIIAKAERFGSVTIAYQYGRRVDIKLGGELPEEIHSVINRILERSGFEQAFSMTMEEKRKQSRPGQRSFRHLRRAGGVFLVTCTRWSRSKPWEACT
jgi:preprotein translocase subunit SecA